MYFKYLINVNIVDDACDDKISEGKGDYRCLSCSILFSNFSSFLM